MLRGAAGDLRLAVRALRGTSAITLAAILTLALGIGATTAVFSVANSLLLRPLPVVQPEQLVTVTSATALRFGFQAGAGWNHAMWEQLQQRSEAFAGAFAWVLQRVDASNGGEVQPLTALVASGGVFDALGVHALAGRTFTAADDVRGGGAGGGVVVISEDVWRRRFNGSADVIGSRVSIDGTPLNIVGVIPRRFRGVDVGQPFDVAMPFSAEALVHGARALRENQRALLLTVMLRLKPGQTIAAATGAMRAMQPQIIGPGAPPFLKDPFIVVPAGTGVSDRSQLRQRYERPLVVVAIISALVLGIVCVNVANLLLARAAARRYELSLRLAVGAPRWRLARQVFIEGLVLGGAGASAGLLFAGWASRALVTQLPTAGGVALEVPADWRVLLFATAVSVITVVFFATAPAFYATRVAPLEALQEHGRASGGDRTGAFSLGLIALQVALSIVLLAGAGLFIQTFTRLAGVPLGFEPNGVLIVTVNTGRIAADAAARQQLYDRIHDATASVPGVIRAGGSIWTPGSGSGGLLTDARGRRADVGGGQSAAFNFVTPGWFEMYGTAFHGGRDFDVRDRADAEHVAIVNESFRRTFMANRAVLGERINAGPCGRDGCVVVGVVADSVYGSSLRDAPPPMVYVPLAQATGIRPDMPVRLSLRAGTDTPGLVRAIATALNGVDPRLTFTVRPVVDDLRGSVSQERLVARLAGFFGVIALLLSAIGLYGVIAYSAARRRGEIGIRLALGAQASDVVRLMVTRIGMSVMAGIVAGLLVAAWLSRFVAPLLYGLEGRDAATLGVATGILAAVAVLAGWRPTFRAVRLDPAQVLREGQKSSA
jgi:putative ABC transport system permease protein